MIETPSGSASDKEAVGISTNGSSRDIFSRSRLIVFAALALILLLGVGVRVWELDYSPIWWDEGNNAFFAHCSVPDLLNWSRFTNDTDPPAHRLALNVWLNLVGDSASKIRAFSIIMGLATVVVVFLWGRRLGGSKTGLLAAAFTALSPMAVYYSREAKGYPMVAFFALLALYLWFAYLRAGKFRWLAAIGYVVSGALAIGTHYYVIFLFVVPFVFALADIVRSKPGERPWKGFFTNWLLPHVAILVIVGPWILLTYDTAFKGATTLESAHSALGLFEYLTLVLSEFAVGPNFSFIAPPWLSLVAVLVLCGAAFYGGCKRFRVVLPLIAGVVVCLSLAFFAQSYVIFFHPRFLFYVAPALYLLAAIGIVQMKWFVALPLAGLLLIWGAAFPSIYQPLMAAEEDLRPIAQYIQTWSEPDDVVIVSYIWQEGALRLYAPGTRSYVLSAFDKYAPVDTRALELLGNHPRAWLLTYKTLLLTPIYPGPFWFEEHTARALVKEQGNNRLSLYLAPSAANYDRGTALDYEEGIHIQLSELPKQVEAGSVLGFSVKWNVDMVPEGNHSFYMHVVDSSQETVAEQDGQPVNSLFPTTLMLPGKGYQDYRALAIWPDTPSGRYSLYIGVYRLDDGTRLKTLNGVPGTAEYYLGEIEITPYVKRP